MTNHQYFFALSLLAVVTLSVTINGIHAINVYDFVNRAGNSAEFLCFNREIGEKYAKDTLIAATAEIWRLFQQTSDAQRRDFQRLNLILDNFPSGENSVPAKTSRISTSTGQISLNANYIASFHGNVKFEITGVLIHELTHLLQWDGNGLVTQNDLWVIEGITDYVRLESGFIPNNWARPGEGKNWYQGYDVTARFLDYCTGYRSNFVAELNKKLRSYGYVDDYFRQLLGKTVYQLWDEYKRFYGNLP